MSCDVVWDYTGEGPSELSFRLTEVDGRTRIALAHTRIPADPVQYGAGWHVHLDSLAIHVSGGDRTANGCDDGDFLATYRALEPRYTAVATGAGQAR